ncbi:MAG: hypothetical protein IH977_11910 [Nitrospinae bacterium]|nr:hypothetical protein [Nitrospinota bacterium]
MTVPLASCGLCLKPRKLRDSHLLPAALYKLLRDPTGGTDPNPVVVKQGRTFTSSKQVSSYFLCESCEQRFSDKGERYILAQCARPNGQFKLRELLQATSPLLDTAKFKVYDVQPLLGSKIDQYLYFAASVFWRASAHSWKMGNDPVDQISLGGQYQEQFRLYLLGKAPFPQKAAIIVHVSTEAQPDLPATIYPCTNQGDGVPRHKFYIPGVLFILFLGRDVPNQFNAVALNGSQRQLMWLCPWQNDSLFVGVVDLVKASTPSRKLRR